MWFLALGSVIILWWFLSGVQKDIQRAQREAEEEARRAAEAAEEAKEHPYEDFFGLN